MKKAIIITRVLLGLPFLIFGLNHFFPFIPHPPIDGVALDYMMGLTKVGYFWPLLRGLEILIGIALISGRFVPLALAVLAPISLHIFLFHAFVMIANLPLAIIILVLHISLIAKYWDYYKQIFTMKSEPKLKLI
jgi:putative oxidoreductase